MLTCKEMVELVTACLEGSLSPAERSRFDAHLAACPGCTTYMDQMIQTIHLTGSLSPENISPEAESALLHAFRDWRQGAER